MTTTNSLNAPVPFDVTKGGTGVATLTTAYGVLCAGTTATGAVQTLASLGSSNQVLTSNGAGALPSFQDAPALAQAAKAWVNYNQSTTTINTSYNVSSVTSNGTGDFTVNFTSALSSANYVVVTGGGLQAAGNDPVTPYVASNTTPTASLVRISTSSFAGGVTESFVSVCCFAT